MNYEQMRQKIKKQYKAQIDELKDENNFLKEKLDVLDKENKKLKRVILSQSKSSDSYDSFERQIESVLMDLYSKLGI